MSTQSKSTLEVVFEDEQLIAINKPSGLIVHSASVESVESLVRDQIAPGAVLLHRLDKGTSGLLLFARRASHTAKFNELFRSHGLRKTYWAVVAGVWPKSLNKIDSPLVKIDTNRWWTLDPHAVAPDSQAVDAKTTFRVLRYADEQASTWLEVLPKTGRTHQIRVHCASAGFPILGDEKYGSTSSFSKGEFALHSAAFRFQHPFTGAQLQIACLPSSHFESVSNEVQMAQLARYRSNG